MILAAPLNPQSWLTQRIERFGEGPCAFVLGSQTISGSSGEERAASKTVWFGAQVGWFELEKLGWHLGFEK